MNSGTPHPSRAGSLREDFFYVSKGLGPRTISASTCRGGGGAGPSAKPTGETKLPREGNTINASLSPLPLSPIVVRNSRILTGIMILMGGLFLVMAPLMLVIAMAEIFPVEGFSFARLIAILTWIAACAGAASGGWSISRTALNMARNTAYLDGNGIEFTLRSGKNTRQDFVGWNQIVSIQQRAAPGNIIFIIGASDGRLIQFTGFTFYRPRKLAKKIAELSRRSIQKG